MRRKVLWCGLRYGESLAKGGLSDRGGVVTGCVAGRMDLSPCPLPGVRKGGTVGAVAGTVAGFAGDVAGLCGGVFAALASGWNPGLKVVCAVVVAKDGGAFERLAVGDADEEVVGAKAGVGNQREGDGWEVGSGFARAAPGAHPFGCRIRGALSRERRSGSL